MTVPLDAAHAHYLHTVMRKSVGTQIAVFNGRDGCFLAEVTELSRKSGVIIAVYPYRLTVAVQPLIWAVICPVEKGSS